jgi:16S rRNA (cytosine967-C5)-methyltransferase
MKVSPARKAAFDVLFRIESERAYSSALLPVVERDLSGADRGLCHELVLGTLRRQIYLDRVIDSFSGGKNIDIEVRIALRLALYQIYFLDRVPQYSAINESVNLVQAARKVSAKGFVNAILRRSTREKAVLKFVDDADRISVETSHPRWLIEKWIGDLGLAEAESLAGANNDNPHTAFRLLTELSNEGAEFVASARRSEQVKGCYIAADGSRLFDLAERGEIYIQDEASQMVASLIELAENGKFLDVCAAPGGKTGLGVLNNRHAGLMVAGELHRSRVGYLRENCRRQGADDVQIVQYDAEKGLPFAEQSFDFVLVDAPCSGTGTIRSNPEIRYHLNPDDLAELHSKQLTILTNASKLVKVGGSLAYSTCSLEREENEAVCMAFLKTGQFESFVPNLAGRFITPDGYARTWPGRDGMDGFFIAQFGRLKD